VGEEYTGATVIEPNKGYVEMSWLLMLLIVLCDRGVVAVVITYKCIYSKLLYFEHSASIKVLLFFCILKLFKPSYF